QMFGYQRADLLGQRFEVLVPERFRRRHAEHVSQYWGTPSARAMGSGLQLFGRRRDGSEVSIDVTLSPRLGGDGNSVAASIRISDRPRLLEAARLTSERLASAVESIQDAFALFDADDRLILCNSVYRRLIDEKKGPLVGLSYPELLDGWINRIEFSDAAAREQFRTERLSVHRGQPTSSFDVRLRDGRKLRVIDRQTAEGGMVKTIWDITEDERHSEELRAARAAAEAASAAKSEFLSSMSHELRTPLNAILGFAQLLQRDQREPLSDRHKARVQQILQGGEHLLRLIDDVLNLARIEAGRVSISTESVDVAGVLEEVRKTLEPMASRQGIEISLEAAPGTPARVAADRTRFAQILLNFGSNAIKYNRPGGCVSFRVEQRDPGLVRVTVQDTGNGIPFDKQHTLFQPFQRAGQETGPIEGTGIGLVITQRLARLMHGDVGFDSTPGVGSRFWVDIPAEVVPVESAEQPTPGPSSSRRSGAVSDAFRRILYVEDNRANVAFMQDLIDSLENSELLITSTAEEAVELLRSSRPDVILMDINLPGMSGIDALRALRSSAATAHIPVIALTAAATERDRQHGLQAGFYRYLTKPVNVDELMEALNSLLQSKTSSVSEFGK
ncbi:MAG TPA: response regulator, partial [Polyangiaceae bacterium]|nr:response regulator [Polyangiaceae bacterium]